MEDQILKQRVINAIQNGRSLYDRILQNDSIQSFHIKFDCTKLVDVDTDKASIQETKYALPQPVIDYFYSELHKLDNDHFKINECACLYIFEIEKECLNIDVANEYRKFRDNPDFIERNKSSIKGKSDTSKSGNILYIGKVKSNIGGRLSTHFGYAHPKTGGLQLRFWGSKIELQLKVHIVCFKKELDDFINPLELVITKQLQPIIGNTK